jgi:hypothetical protein
MGTGTHTLNRLQISMGLKLDLFLTAGRDVEAAQYRILDGLHQVRQAFSRNILYPHLAELVRLHETLTHITRQSSDLRQSLPGQLSKIDLENKTLIYERSELADDQIKAIEDLIEWALPYIQAAIEEGRTVFEFVDENLAVEEVGLVPTYIEEGYLLMPDAGTSAMHVIRYTMSVFTGQGERYRSLKTAHVETIGHGALQMSPHSVKLSLIDRMRDLPNPATFLFTTDLDFPFESTMLPVAKRKLIRRLMTDPGRA